MMNQTYPSFDEEKYYWNQNKLVIGIDEVGRGAFAGPIVAAAVIFPFNFVIHESLSRINDSKLLNSPIRDFLSIEIKKYALFWSISKVDVKTIDKLGIGEANKIVLRSVVIDIIKKTKMQSSNFFNLVDGFYVSGIKNQKSIIKGDQSSITIAAASILAKVYRDRLMSKYHKIYPCFSFETNKGYGTKGHREALKAFGLCDLHRTSFNLSKYV